MFSLSHQFSLSSLSAHLLCESLITGGIWPPLRQPRAQCCRFSQIKCMGICTVLQSTGQMKSGQKNFFLYFYSFFFSIFNSLCLVYLLSYLLGEICLVKISAPQSHFKLLFCKSSSFVSLCIYINCLSFSNCLAYIYLFLPPIFNFLCHNVLDLFLVNYIWLNFLKN